MSIVDEAEAILAEQDFKFKATRVALEIEGHLNTDPWALGDALVVDASDLRGVDDAPLSTAKTGLFSRLSEIRDEMLEYGALTVAKTESAIRSKHQVARAWPPEYRQSEIATYEAHKSLTTSEMSAEQRALKLQRLHRQNKGRRVTNNDVRLWREAQRRAAGQIKTWSREELLGRRLRSSIRNWASPEKVTQLHPDEQTLLIRTLRGLAGEIERGEFR